MKPTPAEIARIKRKILSLSVPSPSAPRTMKDIFYIAEVDCETTAEILARSILGEVFRN